MKFSFTILYIHKKRISLGVFFLCIIFSVQAQKNNSVLEIAEQKERLGKIDTAINLISENIPLANAKTEVYKLLVKRGYLFMSKNKNSEAEQDFDKAINTLADSNQAYAAKGYLYLKIGKFFLSIENFDKAIERGSNHISVYFCRAHALWDVKDYEKAMQGLEKVLLLDKTHPDANYLKGRILARTGKHKEALPWYDKALYLQPQSKIAEVSGYRVVAYYSVGDYQKAEEDLQKSLDGGMNRDEITFAMTEVQRKKYYKK